MARRLGRREQRPPFDREAFALYWRLRLTDDPAEADRCVAALRVRIATLPEPERVHWQAEFADVLGLRRLYERPADGSTVVPLPPRPPEWL